MGLEHVFEHIANAPDREQVASNKLTPAVQLLQVRLQGLPGRQSDPAGPVGIRRTSLKFPFGQEEPGGAGKDASRRRPRGRSPPLNKDFRALLKGTVWENYMLLATQWPSDPASTTDCNGGARLRHFSPNTTLETYSQADVKKSKRAAGDVELHGLFTANATTQHVSCHRIGLSRSSWKKAQCEETAGAGRGQASVLARQFPGPSAVGSRTRQRISRKSQRGADHDRLHAPQSELPVAVGTMAGAATAASLPGPAAAGGNLRTCNSSPSCRPRSTGIDSAKLAPDCRPHQDQAGLLRSGQQGTGLRRFDEDRTRRRSETTLVRAAEKES